MTPAESQRRDDLLATAMSRALTSDEVDEIGTLERRHHDFRLMCTRTAPLNPMAMGYRWDERLEHVAAPGLMARVRTEGMVDIEGESLTLMEATRRVATIAKRGVALADWTGPTGRLGQIVGLEHPARTPAAPAPKPDKPGPAAAIGDLFD